MVPEVIGLVGLQGSGKTEVAKAFAKFNVSYVRMGDVVWKELERRGGEITEANVAKLANELRQKEGLSAIAKRCIPLILEKGKGKRAVIVDGIRGIAEVEEFRRAFGEKFHLLGVSASEGVRYSRVASRGRADDVAMFERFREKDRRELGWGLGEALAKADVTIANEGTLEELRRKAVEFFERVVGKVEASCRG
jgi:dephospho-CoA kinase